MASITPANLYVQSLGSTTLRIAEFGSGVDSGDIWSSGIPNVVAAWANKGDSPTNITASGIAVTWTASSGTFHFSCETDSKPWLFVLSGFGNK